MQLKVTEIRDDEGGAARFGSSARNFAGDRTLLGRFGFRGRVSNRSDLRSPLQVLFEQFELSDQVRRHSRAAEAHRRQLVVRLSLRRRGKEDSERSEILHNELAPVICHGSGASPRRWPIYRLSARAARQPDFPIDFPRSLAATLTQRRVLHGRAEHPAATTRPSDRQPGGPTTGGCAATRRL